MIEVWYIEKGNAAGMFAQSVNSNGSDLPPALPWVEPSLNNLWFEACNSHLCGNYQAAIISTSVLLEFALRMVVSNLEDVPSIREDHDEMFGKQTLRPVINCAKGKGLLSGDTKKWWDAYCEHIRNKICHGDLLHILDDCREVPQFVDYFDPKESRNNTTQYSYEQVITHPAVFHHKSGIRFSKHFLHDAYGKLSDLIKQTKWEEYDERWKSQRIAYESYFAYRWNYSSLKSGIQSARRPFGSAS